MSSNLDNDDLIKMINGLHKFKYENVFFIVKNVWAKFIRIVGLTYQ